MNISHISWLLVSDVFKGQWTDKVKDLVRKSNGMMVPVPNNWSNYFQPLEVTVNKSSKDFLRQKSTSLVLQRDCRANEKRQEGTRDKGRCTPVNCKASSLKVDGAVL